MCTKNLKFVATDVFPKIISPSAGENSGDSEAAPAVLKWSGQEVGGAMSSGGCG